jgi:predicted LPLAT superfamily acyltransferase
VKDFGPEEYIFCAFIVAVGLFFWLMDTAQRRRSRYYREYIERRKRGG